MIIGHEMAALRGVHLLEERNPLVFIELIEGSHESESLILVYDTFHREGTILVLRKEIQELPKSRCQMRS